MSDRKRILVADDDSGIRDLIRAYLIPEGYEIFLARDGAEAWSRVTELRPDAMILDINMPQMDGFGVLEAIRPGRGEGRGVPVLVLTARHAADDVRRAVSLGAKDYLTKPFTKSQLLARMARLIRPPMMVKTGAAAIQKSA